MAFAKPSSNFQVQSSGLWEIIKLSELRRRWLEYDRQIELFPDKRQKSEEFGEMENTMVGNVNKVFDLEIIQQQSLKRHSRNYCFNDFLTKYFNVWKVITHPNPSANAKISKNNFRSSFKSFRFRFNSFFSCTYVRCTQNIDRIQCILIIHAKTSSSKKDA